jgi:hypothetical protein
MFKKSAIISILLVVLVMLSACGSSATTASSSVQSQQVTPSNLTLQNKLGLGILKLQGTSLAVTTEQANTLLPLWKAVKVLSTNNITSPAEMTALYQQIEDSLTSNQVQAIKNLSLTQAELNTLIQQQGSSTATKSSSAQSQSGAAGLDDGGIPFTGGSSDISAMIGQTTSSTTATKTSTVKSSTSSASQLNVVFANSIITLLQKQIS